MTAKIGPSFPSLLFLEFAIASQEDGGEENHGKYDYHHKESIHLIDQTHSKYKSLGYLAAPHRQ